MCIGNVNLMIVAKMLKSWIKYMIKKKSLSAICYIACAGET